MLKGCGLSILLSVATYFWVNELIKNTPLEEHIWIPIVLAVGMLAFIGNIWGVFIAFSQKKSLGKLEDGKISGISGRISCKGSPIEGPFSKKPAIYVEYKAITFIGSSKNRREIGYYGLKSVKEAYVSSYQGTVKLKGFPILTQISKTVLNEEMNYKNAEEFFNSVTFNDGNPINEIQKILELENEIPEYHSSRGDPSFNSSYQLSEALVENGAEVTVFGKYDRSTNSLDISANSFSHSIQLGKGEEVVAKSLRNSVIMSIFFGLLIVVALIVLYEALGVDLLSPYCLECKELIKKYI